MDKLIAQFPKQIADALEIAKDAQLDSLINCSFKNVVICGMGGSGIGGKIVSQWFYSQSNVPITVVQGYNIPNFVDKDTLVIGSTYSGNTEETLTAVKAAEKKGATIISISSGGEMIRFCKEIKSDYIRVPGGNPPRSMLAFSVIQLVKILSAAGVISKEALHQIDNCRHLLNAELLTIKQEAKKMASHIYEKQCVLYGPTELESVLIRARQQINENAKQLCWHHVIPEMNHNELVGWGGGNDDIAVIFFISQFIGERNKLRFKLSEEIISEKTKSLMTIEGRGKTLVEEYFYFIHIIDWGSVYLAELNGVDPVEIRVIEYLKDSLDKS